MSILEYHGYLVSVFDILQGTLKLGVAASGVEEVHIEVNLDVGLNAYTLRSRAM